MGESVARASSGWPTVGVCVGAIAALAAIAVLGVPVHALAPLLLVTAAVTLSWRSVLQWRSLLAAMVLVILFIPIRRYSLPGSLPINLEPYRLVVALVAGAWLASALIDPRVRLRRGGVVDAPLVAFLVVVILSVVANISRVRAVDTDAIKSLLFLASYIIVLYLVASLVKTYDDLDFQIKVLVYGGAIVAVFCLIEKRTHYNAFDHLSQIAPFLRQSAGPTVILDARGARVIGSSQHPIAMGVALVMLVPLAVYRALAFRGILAWIAAGIMVMGAMSTISRTAVVALLAVLIAMLAMKPRYLKRMWPALFPLLFLAHFAMPGTISTIGAAFFPSTGLIAQQTSAPVGSGRLATLGPALRSEFLQDPAVGEGFGTRVTTPDSAVPIPNAPILDDQWLGLLLETGVAGVLAFLWFLIRFVRRVGRAAKDDETARGWLLSAVTASVIGYGVSMLFYDALSFIQVTFLFFILIGLGSAAYKLGGYESSAALAVSRRQPRLASAMRAGS
jgi:polysaccharide biosynthesis protein PslJ